MRAIATTLSDQDITDIADYYESRGKDEAAGRQARREPKPRSPG